jgi:hypothetical protein
MTRLMLTVVVALLAAVPTVSHAGAAKLTQSSTTSGYSANNFGYCGSGTRNFMVSYEYCPGIIIIGGSCGPYGTCGANPYRIKANLYHNGNLISSMQYQTSSSWANFPFYNVGVQAGTYKATVTLEKRNWTCIGWSTVETVSTSVIVANAAPATPNFNINGIPPPASGAPINVCASNIKLNADPTTCENHYFVTVQESDRWWTRTNDYEWGRWFSGQAPNGLNLQQLSTTFSYSPYFIGSASRQGSPLIGGNLPGGAPQHYRVSVCTGEPSWNCKTGLIKVDGNCFAATAEDGDDAQDLSDEERSVVEEERGPISEPMPDIKPPTECADPKTKAL